MIRPLFALPVALAALAVPVTARHHDEVPAATPTGKPVSCIPLSNISETRVRNDEVIDFVGRDRHVYRNTLPQGCPELGFEQRFSYETSLSELCSTDIITVLHSPPAMQGASCGLGQFQPVTLAAR